MSYPYHHHLSRVGEKTTRRLSRLTHEALEERIVLTQPPVIISPSDLFVNENQTAVGQVIAIDSEDDRSGTPLSYAITGGADEVVFVVSPTGLLTMTDAANFESPSDGDSDNVYEVDVTVFDSSGLTDTQAISVTIGDVNEAPVFLADYSSGMTVPENSSAVTFIGATDEDGDSVQYEIIGGEDRGLLTVLGGELRFEELPDFEFPDDLESDNLYQVNVQISDPAGNSNSQMISITVTNELEPPRIEHEATVFQVTEGETAVSRFIGSDDEDHQFTATPLSWSISGGADSGLFAIDQTGAVTFALAPDFDSPLDATGDNIYEVELTVADSDGMTDSLSIEVIVLEDEFAIDPSVSVTIDGNTVIAVGTRLDDEVHLTLGDDLHLLRIGDGEYEFDASVIDTFRIGAGDPTGEDSITVIGTSQDDEVTMFGTLGEIWSDNYHVYTYLFDSIVFEGGNGYDYGQLFGSNDIDTLAGLHQDTTLTTPANHFQLTGFERVDSYGRGGDDYAQVYGTQQADQFFTFDGYEVLAGFQHQQTTIGFFRVDAYGREGNDRAFLFDTAGDDELFVFPDYVVMQSVVTKAVAKGFESLNTTALNGGNDVAYLLDLTSLDALHAAGNVARLTSAVHALTVNNFETVVAEIEEDETPSVDVSVIDFLLVTVSDWLNL